MRICRPFIALCCLLAASCAWPDELVIMVDRAADMPMSRIDDGVLTDGVHKVLGDALARNMGRTPRYLILPRKRISLALENGEADILCGYMPEWIPGNFIWTQPVFTAEEVLVTDARLPRPHAIADLAGQTIGTVLGYAHPEIEQVLGPNFVRDDAPNMEVNLEKFARGRVHHILIASGVFAYRQRMRHPPLAVHPPMPVAAFATRCAVSRKAKVDAAEVDRAIGQAYRDGTIAAILEKFR